VALGGLEGGSIKLGYESTVYQVSFTIDSMVLLWGEGNVSTCSSYKGHHNARRYLAFIKYTL